MNRETAAEHWPVASRADAPEPDQTLYQDGKVRLSQRRLALPGRTIDLRVISSVWADQQRVKTGGSNWFLKAPGFLFMFGGGLLSAVGSGLFLLQLLFHALYWFGFLSSSSDPDPFEPNSAIKWVIHGAAIGIALLVFHVGNWLNGKGARTQSMHCAAVAVDGESETTYFGHTADSLSAELMVAEVRRAQGAARSAEDAKDWN